MEIGFDRQSALFEGASILSRSSVSSFDHLGYRTGDTFRFWGNNASINISSISNSIGAFLSEYGLCFYSKPSSSLDDVEGRLWCADSEVNEIVYEVSEFSSSFLPEETATVSPIMVIDSNNEMDNIASSSGGGSFGLLALGLPFFLRAYRRL